MSKQNRNSKKDFKRKILGLLVISLPHTVESMEQDTGQLDVEIAKLEVMITQLIAEITRKIRVQMENHKYLLKRAEHLNPSLVKATEGTKVLSVPQIKGSITQSLITLAVSVTKEIRQIINEAKNNSILVRTAEQLESILLYINSKTLTSVEAIGECSKMVTNVIESYKSDTGIHNLKTTALSVMNIKQSLTEASKLCIFTAKITEILTKDLSKLSRHILEQLDEFISNINKKREIIQPREEREDLEKITKDLFQVREDLFQLVKEIAPITTAEKLEKNKISTTEVELKKNETTSMSPQTTEHLCFFKKK